MKEDESARRLAAHEAGHAVMAHFLKIPFVSVSTVGDAGRGSAGHIEMKESADVVESEWGADGEFDTTTRISIECHLMTLLAGMLAEVELFGSLRAEDVDGAQGDRSAAIQIAMQCSGSVDECQAYIDWLIIRVANKLRTPLNRVVLQAVADRLADGCTLTFQDIDLITNEARSAALTERRPDRRRNPRHSETA